MADSRIVDFARLPLNLLDGERDRHAGGGGYTASGRCSWKGEKGRRVDEVHEMGETVFASLLLRHE